VPVEESLSVRVTLEEVHIDVLSPFHALSELCRVTSMGELVLRLFQHSRRSLITALALSDSTKTAEKIIDSSDHCTLLYNLLCVSWRLHLLNSSPDDVNANSESDSVSDCEKFLRQYMRELSAEKRRPVTEIVDEVMSEIQNDNDIIGLFESDLCARVRQEMAMS
jgi:hypothetical protein